MLLADFRWLTRQFIDQALTGMRGPLTDQLVRLLAAEVTDADIVAAALTAHETGMMPVDGDLIDVLAYAYSALSCLIAEPDDSAAMTVLLACGFADVALLMTADMTETEADPLTRRFAVALTGCRFANLVAGVVTALARLLGEATTPVTADLSGLNAASNEICRDLFRWYPDVVRRVNELVSSAASAEADALIGG